MNLDLRTVNVIRYITPLREGGSLPALAEADDDFKYVLKFRGAGHGVKALIAEYLGGQIAGYLGLPVPELVFATLDEAFGRTEADEEIQDLLKFVITSYSIHYTKLYDFLSMLAFLLLYSRSLLYYFLKPDTPQLYY